MGAEEEERVNDGEDVPLLGRPHSHLREDEGVEAYADDESHPANRHHPLLDWLLILGGHVTHSSPTHSEQQRKQELGEAA
eukprot:CAMPEP_0185755166 /NCGR_PEP_ID=MMETSP1174-20130828/13694_1 /TAXON_ID=35687 /ORGANISM="Dictyocha speculum, Strain CCMP1381" /LENGTH=79 /DNA_ID=CAMNT_0028433615 /DNA_START=798 /DNA_END=1034 /DNA_ORIENTATION=-